MAEDDLIGGYTDVAHDPIGDYVDELRLSMRWRSDLDELLLELEDHLRSKAEARRLAGSEDADRETIEEFGSALEVARSFAVTGSGGLAVPTTFTRRTGTIALIAAVAWVASMAIGFVGQGELLVPWTLQNYQIWAATTAVAAILATVALTGALVRGGGGRDAATIAAVAFCGLAVAGAVLATWASVVLLVPFAFGALIVFGRLRSVGLASWTSFLLIAAWPVGAVLGLGLAALEFGYVDSYGDHPAARVVGFTVASTLWAIGLARIGLTLRREEPVHLTEERATA